MSSEFLDALGLEALYQMHLPAFFQAGLPLPREQFIGIPGIPLMSPLTLLSALQENAGVEGWIPLVQIMPRAPQPGLKSRN